MGQTGKWNKILTVRKNATAELPLGGDIKKPGMSRRFDAATFHKTAWKSASERLC